MRSLDRMRKEGFVTTIPEGVGTDLPYAGRAYPGV